ncbi:GntR family transcriptional regulator [Anaerobacillus arseniciselenatis]|uniref:GntR family transcriptional regulator n=1 Tax=Anaerobacillus arseniciselenatis TaxID=85682 RepID=A0A1S2LK76_9BACI|nr:GntR family transcriptional regulator [Anaerobacillus arseniciselenatis]OIJ12776.1 GntR family transcriptional regulator [Anaerobacillus arseniciselenatis]
MSVTFDNSKPIYLQLMDHFFQQICSGSLKLGEKLPSVRETAVSVGVNPNTVQRTYQEMERKGVVVAKRGQGSFVTEDESMIKQLRSEISEEYVNKFVVYMQNNGFSEAEILERVKIALQSSNGER